MKFRGRSNNQRGHSGSAERRRRSKRLHLMSELSPDRFRICRCPFERTPRDAGNEESFVFEKFGQNRTQTIAASARAHNSDRNEVPHLRPMNLDYPSKYAGETSL